MLKIKRAILVLFVLFAMCKRVNAQRLITIKSAHGLYYQTMADLQKRQGATLAFYNFHPHDTIASIGAQACNWEAAYAATCDSVFFYLEDIDSTYCNAQQAAAAWNYYGFIKGDKLSAGYSIIIGDEATTHLPNNSCNKILISNSFHEFSRQADMLDDIGKKLKPGGILYIDEVLAAYHGELHANCRKPLYMEAELIAFVEKNGFKQVNSLPLAYNKKRTAREIFAFVKN